MNAPIVHHTCTTRMTTDPLKQRGMPFMLSGFLHGNVLCIYFFHRLFICYQIITDSGVQARQASKDLGELKTQKRKRELYLKAGFCEQLSPFCKIVRERLVELELPHVYYNAARGSPKRNYLLERTGIFQVPFLEDPNTGVEMFESSEIIKYLNTTYAL
ncbi:hypothetical protein SELMODRAFT_424815 [Selaginella moellendorffii]|uniref:GST N-terminal domain-containing protein n=1 Tax=Selaginella moellendorffii TaxID=88036 RepID=D8SR39_SELML|nr:hypothetical protein SELMODRAFT_424815 [Selaginella moellendorffii]